MKPSFEQVFKEKIQTSGPLRLDLFMAEALGHPTLGYYTTHQPIGESGDFTTAPEISPLFGEMLGLWCVDVWEKKGAPVPFHLIELGPGRGTLMADALRAMKRVSPRALAAAHIHLVETSPRLHQEQEEKLSTYTPQWHDTLDTVPQGPCIILANEFFDALPIRQFQRLEKSWGEMYVALTPDKEQFCFQLDTRPAPIALLISLALQNPLVGTVVEMSPAAWAIMKSLVQHLKDNNGAALIVDYGYVTPPGKPTLQVVQKHRAVSPLHEPGLSDMTAHVDFSALIRVAQEMGASVSSPVNQMDFLNALGLSVRLEQVARHQPDTAEAIISAAQRLVDPHGMGTHFKVLTVGL